MKKLFKMLMPALVVAVTLLPLAAQDHTSLMQHDSEHKMINQKELQWQDGPASLPKGVKIAMLEGDMSKDGPFAIRIQFPANYKIPAHWHPAIEHVTVLKGSFYMGSGETYDTSTATKLSEGAFAVMPVKYVHYAFTKEGATIQLHGIGPWGITYVNEADDPRNKK